MDLNRLYFLHQQAIIRVSTLKDGNERKKFVTEADNIALQISEFQDRKGARCAELLPADLF